MGQLNCLVSGICGDLRAPHIFADPTVCGLFAGPCSFWAICRDPQFCGLLRAPTFCGLYVVSQFCGLMIDGMWALVQKTEKRSTQPVEGYCVR